MGVAAAEGKSWSEREWREERLMSFQTSSMEEQKVESFEVNGGKKWWVFNGASQNCIRREKARRERESEERERRQST